jgi:cysteine-S-conjugate beta-lyase
MTQIIDFDEKILRINSGSVKWDDAETIFGANDILPMWVADMDFLSPSPVIEALKSRAAHGVYGYPAPGSYSSAAVVHWLNSRHGWETKSEWMQSVPGVVTAISVAVQTFTRPGDGVIIQPPVYPPFFSSVLRNDRSLIENPLIYADGDYKMDFADLSRKARGARMLILCNPHNPVGRVWSRMELETLAQICLDNNLLILSDEIHCDLIFRGHRHTPLASLGGALQNQIITCIAPSKTFNTAGLYTSTVIIPDTGARQQFIDALQTLGIAKSNVFGLTAWEAAYNQGGPWLDQLLVYLEGNAAYLTQFVAQNLPRIKVHKPEGTYLAWLDCCGLGLDADQLGLFFAQEAKVGLNNGATFGKQGEGFMRLNFGCPRSVLAEGLDRIAQAYNSRSF